MTHAVHRRTVLMAAAGALLTGCSAASGRRPRPPGLVGPAVGSTTSEQALAALLTGNRRFVAGTPLHAGSIAEARVFAGVQHPLAVVLGCSDSRLAPELLFDQGFGDLFVVRVVGGVLDTSALASIEYAVTELTVPLVVVLGHERCGAIRAAVDAVRAREAQLPVRTRTNESHLAAIIERLEPIAVAAVNSGASDTYEKAMRLAVSGAAATLEHERFLAGRRVQIATSHYDLDDGMVRLLS